MLRAQLPAYSPIPGRCLQAGLRRMIRGTEEAEDGLRALLIEHLGARDLLLTDSGTSALCLALKALGGGGTATVAMPAYGCYDLATAADCADVRVLLYDLEPESLSPRVESLGSALEAGADAVILAHWYGIPADLSRIVPLVEEAGSVLIEDAAQALGMRFDGRPAGGWGSFAIFSFGRGKGWTGGTGGALLFNDTRAAQMTSDLPLPPPSSSAGISTLARAYLQWLLGRPALYDALHYLPFLQLGETRYKPPPTPASLPLAARGVLQCSWERAWEEVQIRRRHASRLLELIRRSEHLGTVSVPDGGTAGYLRLPVLLRGSARTRCHGDGGGRRLGIMPGYPKPLHRLEGFAARIQNPDATLPGAETLCRQLVTLPTHSLLTPSDLRQLERWIATAPRERN